MTQTIGINLPTQLAAKLVTLAKNSVPFELCGIIYENDEGELDYKEIENIHDTPKTHYMMHPQKLKAARDKHGIVAYWHTHPNGTSAPSPIDLHVCRVHDTPMVIVGTKDSYARVTFPEKAPLIGREYHHGTTDCFSIVRDYYSRELGININDFAREDLWWENQDNASLYMENFAQEGFVEVPKHEMRKHDVMICFWGDTMLPNHALIFLGHAPKLKSENHREYAGNALYLHHPYNRPSTVCILGEDRLSTVACVVRHKDLL